MERAGRTREVFPLADFVIRRFDEDVRYDGHFLATVLDGEVIDLVALRLDHRHPGSVWNYSEKRADPPEKLDLIENPRRLSREEAIAYCATGGSEKYELLFNWARIQHPDTLFYTGRLSGNAKFGFRFTV